MRSTEEVKSGDIDVKVAAWTGCVLLQGNRLAKKCKKKQIKQFRVILDEQRDVGGWLHQLRRST